MGSVATNVLRAISSVDSLIEFPAVKTRTGWAGSVTLQGSVGIDKTAAPTGSAGGALNYTYKSEIDYDSTDGILRDLRKINEAIRINTARAISVYNIAVPNADPQIADAMKPLGEIPTDGDSSMAVGLVSRAAQRANEVAQNEYTKWSKRSVPSEFYNFLTGVKVF